MSNATLQVGGGNWAAQDGKLLGYAVEPTSGRYLAREFTVNRNSSKWVLGSDGYLYEVPADQPALEYYSDGTFRGALVEPESVNNCKQSENINITWEAFDVTPTQSTKTTPDGDSTNKYIKLVDDNTNSQKWIRQNLGTSGTFTFSCYIKADSFSQQRYVALTIAYTSSAAAVALFNPNTGQLVDSKVNSFNIINTNSYYIGNGWYRVSLTASSSLYDERRVVIGLSNSSSLSNITLSNPYGLNSYTGDGTSGVYIWGMQFEQSPIATSYIPTTTGAVTRLKDDIFFTNASSVIGHSEGTLFVEVDWQDSGASQVILSINDDSVDNRFELFGLSGSDEIRLGIASNGSTQTPLDVSSSGLTGIVKLTAAYADGDSEIYINGSSIGSGTPDLSSLGTLTNVDFGQNWNSGGQANMWIRDARIYNTRLTDTQCQDLTTL